MLLPIFPGTADNRYRGSRTASWAFAVLAVVSTARSLIHVLAPDGGAGSIAGLDLSEGAANIVFAFGLWGISQLVYAGIQLLVAFRYRTLIPLFYLVLILETLGRMSIGFLKAPVLLHGTPPGGIANYVLLPCAVVLFALSRRERKGRPLPQEEE